MRYSFFTIYPLRLLLFVVDLELECHLMHIPVLLTIYCVRHRSIVLTATDVTAGTHLPFPSHYRYLYYMGRVQAIQLEYSDSYQVGFPSPISVSLLVFAGRQ
jgi:hypothetical protein